MIVGKPICLPCPVYNCESGDLRLYVDITKTREGFKNGRLAIVLDRTDTGHVHTEITLTIDQLKELVASINGHLAK